MPIPTKEGQEVFDSLPIIYHNNVKGYVDKYCEGDGRDYTVDKFTCCDCPHVKTCEYSYDLYNTNGDCLALK